MIDFAERTAEVAGQVKSGFQTDDPQLVEALLAARIACALPYPWLILEADWYQSSMQEAWFALGDGEGESKPTPLGVIRCARPRQANETIDLLLSDRDRPRIFVEPEWRDPPQTNHRLRIAALERHSLRLRTRMARSGPPSPTALQGLKYAAEKALDPRFRTARARMPSGSPPGLLYWAELVQRLALHAEDWSLLIRNLYSLAARRAYLFDREECDSEDWSLALRALADSIPWTTGQMLPMLMDHGGRWDALRPRFGERAVEREMRRLADRGIVRPWRNQWLIERREDVMALIHGKVSLECR